MRTIYYNGSVYTGELPLQQAFVEEDGIFLYAGDTETAKMMADSEEQLVDLEGRFVCAGFNDSHMHVLGFGKLLKQAILAEHTSSLADVLACLKEFEGQPDDTGLWLLGRGWNQDFFSDVKRMPNRYDLDTVSAERPICIIRACGHCLVVNSKALELLHITEETQSPEGGVIGVEDGVLDGRFYDNAMDLITNAFPAPSKEDIKQMLRVSCKKLNSYGVTSCQTDDYSMFRTVPWEMINEAYQELETSNELTVRIYEQSNFTTVEELKHFVEAGNRTGVGSQFFKIGPLKMLGDGALGARTAFLKKPYVDNPTTYGIPVFTEKQFEEMIGFANANGMQVAVHAIGDACLDWVLNAIEKALRENPRGDHRHGIVHCQITRPDQLEKIKELNLHIYAQSIFLDYDIHIVKERVGEELAATSYCWKTLMRDGISVSNGSDCPVEFPDELAGIQCAVTRKPLKDTEGKYVYLPEEAFTVQEAIDSFTVKSTEGSFEEAIKGKIQKGMLADFVILDKSPFEIDANDIKDIEVLATYVGGKKVYEK